MKRRFAPRQPSKSAAKIAAAPKAAPATAKTSAKTSAPGLPRFVSSAPLKKEKPDLSRQPKIVREALKQPGQPLDVATRRTLEPRFGRDLSDVRVHTTPTAAKSAAALRAEAYTLGSHIVFNAGRYSPNSPDGRRLLAHELTHVAQQTQSGNGAPVASTTLEAQADRNAATVHSSGPPISVTAAPLGIACRRLSSGETSTPAAGDHAVHDIGGPNWWYVFYNQSFKVVKKIFHEGKDTGQIGPNWVCNNPGNMTCDPSKIGDPKEPNLAVLSRICRDHNAFSDTFNITGIPLAIFPTIEKGRAALMAWFQALLTPSHTYWTELGVTRKAQSILGAVSEHAPKTHGANDPAKYADIVTKSINDSRAAAGSRGKISSTAVATVSPAGTGAQEINSADIEAWAKGSETAEGGTLPGFSWEVSDGQSLPSDFADKLAKTGGAPPVLIAWCSAHKVSVPTGALPRPK